MMFSIIIPTCNRPSFLKKCLDELVSIISDDTEIIVSDDSDNDETKCFIENNYPTVKWVIGPRNGIGANRNNAAKYTNGEWLILIDDDCIPNKNIIDVYRKAIDDFPNCKAFEGCILPDDENLLKSENAECPVNTSGGCFWTANVCINKLIFKSINGFDENLKFFNEDQDIYIRLKTKTNIPFLSNATVIHPVRFTSLFKRIKKAHRSYVDLLKFKRKTEGESKIFFDSCYRHLYSVFLNVKQKKFKMVVFHIYHFLIIIPLKHFTKF